MFPLALGAWGAKVLICTWGRILVILLEQNLWFCHRGFQPGDSQRDAAFQVAVLDASGPNRALAPLTWGLSRETGMCDCRESYLWLMRPTERENLHLANQWGWVESSPLVVFEIEKLLSAQGRHKLWAQKGQVSQVIICLGIPWVRVVINRRDYVWKCHLIFMASGCMPGIRSGPLTMCTFLTTMLCIYLRLKLYNCLLKYTYKKYINHECAVQWMLTN